MGHPALLYLSIFLSAVGGFLFGYDTGVIAGAMPLIERDVKFWGEKGSGENVLASLQMKNDPMLNPDEATLWLSLITSMTVAFAFIFSFVGGWITERLVKIITYIRARCFKTISWYQNSIKISKILKPKLISILNLKISIEFKTINRGKWFWCFTSFDF